MLDPGGILDLERDVCRDIVYSLSSHVIIVVETAGYNADGWLAQLGSLSRDTQPSQPLEFSI